MDNDRLEKVEFFTSEQDRMTRMLNVCISDPTINPNAENLLQHAKDFLLNKMKMDNRMLDANVFVKKPEGLIQFSLLFLINGSRGFYTFWAILAHCAARL